MASSFSVISPVDSQALVACANATSVEIDPVLHRSLEAFRLWRRTPLQERTRLVLRFVECFMAKKDVLAKEITLQMGR